MEMVRPLRHLLLAGMAPVMLTACGGGGGGGVDPIPAPPATPTPPPQTQTEPPVTATPTAPAAPTTPSTPTNYDTTEYRASRGLVQANAITAYNAGYTGRGVTSAIVDGGIDTTNADFAGRISAASADVAANRGLRDEGGHGTAVAAVLGAARNDAGPLGMAFETTLLIARSDTPGSCASGGKCDHRDTAIARGVDLAVQERARVINLSLGGSAADPSLRAAIGRATAAGIVVVIAGGNDALADPDALAQIANDAGVARGLVVIAGATNRAGDIASFSNRAGNGAASYLMALGEGVLSYDQTGAQFLYSGTSFSAPLISGAVALLAQAFPNLTGQQIVQLLYSTATDLGTAGIDTTYGRGALNLTRAFQPQGQLSLAGTAVPVTPGQGITLSTAMGDAKAGASTLVLDGYGRAYGYALGAACPAPAPRLIPALAGGMHGTSVTANGATVAMTIAGDPAAPQVARLALSPGERLQARAVAGLVAGRLGQRSAVAFGFAQGARRLVDTLAGRDGGGFLVAVDPLATPGFDVRPGNGLAVRHAFGHVGITLSAENGETARLRFDPRDRTRHAYAAFGAVLDRRFGPVAATLGVSRMREADSVLGARFGALGGGGGTTDFVDATLALFPAPGWTISAAARRGWTRMAGGGVVTGGALRSAAYGLDVVRTGLLGSADRLSLRIAQPLRVTSGGYRLGLPVAWDYATGTATFAATRFDLAPTGRERDVEAGWSTPLAAGWLGASLFWRRDPGHIASAPDDRGAALRLFQPF